MHTSLFTDLYIFCAILFTTGTTTELPACLYKCELAKSGNLNDSGKPCNAKHSLGVNFLIPYFESIREHYDLQYPYLLLMWEIHYFYSLSHIFFSIDI